MTSYRFLEDIRDCRAEYGFPLKEHTSFKIGGVADAAFFPKTPEAAAELIKRLSSEKMRFTVAGNCTNVLFCGPRYEGAVLFTKELCTFSQNDNTLSFGAGIPMTSAALKAKSFSLTGLEFAYGIPGSFGGGVFMNAGAYGGQLSDVVTRSTVCDKKGNIFTLDAKEHLFGYRSSVFQNGELFVLETSVELSKGDFEKIKATMDDLMQRRRDKQPLELPSAGSVFKRGDGFITAQLIDSCGLKGLTAGGAQVSEKHAGFIVNTGEATAEDVLCLIAKIKEEVLARSGKKLECEIRIIK